jgi:hypothetical protein
VAVYRLSRSALTDVVQGVLALAGALAVTTRERKSVCPRTSQFHAHIL